MTQSRSHQTRRAALLSLLLILSVVGGAAFAGTTAAAVASSDRSVGDETVQPGESVEVTIVTTLDESGERLQVTDDFDPAFAETSVTSVQYNGDPVIPVAAIGQPTFIEVALEENFQAGDTVTVTYEVTLPEDADPGDTFNSTGFSAVDDSTPVNHTGTTAISINRPPAADAGSDQTVNEGSVTTLTASESSDPDGDALSYSWAQTSGPDVNLLGNDTETPNFTAPEVGTNTTLSFDLTVSDGNLTDTDVVNVTIEQVNTPPMADAGADQTVEETAEVQLDAGNSSDPDSGTLSYAWTQTSGPTVELTNNDTSTPNFTAPEVNTDTTLSFLVEVSDGSGGSDTDTANVTVVQVNQPPTADAGENQSVSESTTVTLSATESSDPDGDSLNYSWTQTSGPPVEISDSEAESPEFTAPSVSTATNLTFQLEVSDGALTDTDSVTVAIEPALAPANFSVSNLSAPASVTKGDPVTVIANITNTGDREGTQTVDFRLDSDESETLEEDETVLNETVTLAGDESQSVEFELPTDSIEPGTYLHGVVTENDTQTAQVNITEAPIPANLTVDDLAAPSTVTQGENVTVTANITNTGGAQGTVGVTLNITSNDMTVVTETQTVSLASGENTTVTFENVTSDLAPNTDGYTLTITAAESEATSTLTVEEPPAAIGGDENATANDIDGDGMFEDVNGDGNFTTEDVFALFNNQADAEDNAAAFDFNGDGEFNVLDVQRLLNEQGEAV